MDNTHTNLDGRFIIALGRAMRSIHKESEAMLRAAGLTMAQFAALEALHHKGDMTVGALIEAVLSTSGNMTVVIRNLEQNELVLRKENPSDRRSFIVCLTKRGREIIAAVFERHMELVGKNLSQITEEEKNTVIKILRKLQ